MRPSRYLLPVQRPFQHDQERIVPGGGLGNIKTWSYAEATKRMEIVKSIR